MLFMFCDALYMKTRKREEKDRDEERRNVDSIIEKWVGFHSVL